ncbi:hypothetical protein NQ152_01670 [Microbacterium sp. zg.B48]|uniref:hypothetical protein n=1 Tax=unclassified Microbacterium TaxID=2609290 RepID=UPI00214ADB06|nr:MULTISPECIES: hypothetical protein [unclassified Microbacterium]MCR2762209.1 hypothetical protein [Microbacterium sp. zg.B48]MCR2809784.1 hypothetical protein [Microbacterium sp. zg.B185]WIM17905.1 hypothetical protein QNO12_09765 [Microbacterium sp. zg-B185]
MQILLALLIGAVIGAALHFLAPARGTRGVVLAPVLGALMSGLLWMILTWAGQGLDSPWLWLSAFLAPIAVVYPALVILARTRTAHDAQERARLKIG